MWVYHVADIGDVFPADKYAIARAMRTSGCAASDFDDAQLKGQLLNFPIGAGHPDDTCKLIKECDPLFPLVVCALPANQQASDQLIVNPAFATFFKSLAAR